MTCILFCNPPLKYHLYFKIGKDISMPNLKKMLSSRTLRVFIGRRCAIDTFSRYVSHNKETVTGLHKECTSAGAEPTHRSDFCGKDNARIVPGYEPTNKVDNADNSKNPSLESLSAKERVGLTSQEIAEIIKRFQKLESDRSEQIFFYSLTFSVIYVCALMTCVASTR